MDNLNTTFETNENQDKLLAVFWYIIGIIDNITCLKIFCKWPIMTNITNYFSIIKNYKAKTVSEFS